MHVSTRVDVCQGGRGWWGYVYVAMAAAAEAVDGQMRPNSRNCKGRGHSANGYDGPSAASAGAQSQRQLPKQTHTHTHTHIHMRTQVNLGDAGDREARVLLARYASGLASLERPRLSAEVAADAPRLQAYGRALQVAVQAARPGVCLCG